MAGASLALVTMTRTRLLQVEDAERLHELRVANRAFLRPFEPLQDDEFFTLAGQHAWIAGRLAGYAEGTMVPHVIVEAGLVIGQITLSNIVWANFLSGVLGYWVAEAHCGQGHATSAVAQMCRLAFDELGLHRVQAGTLTHNIASQTVLTRNGFTRFGLAPRYLRIAGEWQDHILFQRLSARA
jgi:ribosomal-protein-alanine N-acetyltransferase